MKAIIIHSQLRRTVLFTVSFILLATVLLAYLVNSLVIEEEQLLGKISRNIIHRLQLDELTRLEANAKDVAWLDATVNYLQHPDPDWPEENIGSYLQKNFDFDFTLILDANNKPVYASFRDSDTQPDWLTRINDTDLKALLAETRANSRIDDPEPEPDTVSGYEMLDGTLTMVAAALILPEDEPNEHYADDHVIVLGRYLDKDYLAGMAQLLELNHLRFSSGAGEHEASYDFLDPEGKRLASMSWQLPERTQGFDQLILTFLIYILVIASVAIVLFYHIYRIARRFAHYANLDEITGLYNRRYFSTIADQEMKRFSRHENTIAFLLIDVDRFKRYNDTYGHQAGDQALQLVGTVMRQIFRRTSDHAFRMGGEEFGAIFLCKDVAHAMDIAESLRTSIEQLDILHEGNSPYDRLTVSIGLYTVAADDNELSVQQAYANADKALYLAKESGRNRVEQFQQESTDNAS